MKFIISRHARERMKQRGIPHPKERILRKCSKKYRRKIKESCRKNGYDSANFAYYRSGKIIYIGVFLTVGVFKVITAFELR